MKINLAVDLQIQAFSGSGITDYVSGVTNCIINKIGEEIQITQRPSIDISEDGSVISALNNRARGIYYWENNLKLYIVHDNDVYQATQDSTAVGTITTGTERVSIFESTGTIPYMIILDAENNEGWVMVAATTVTQIASNFPTTLVHGGASLDGYLFVMDEDGIIYNSAVDDPITFPATGFVSAERDTDGGVYLGKHHDNIVAFGTRTTEFLYDASNTVGSPLNRRQDIAYNIGCVSGLSVWENGDVTYFLGSNRPGQIQVYKLENFQLSVISTDAINSYITQGITESSLKIVFNGLSVMGHDTLLMTVYTLSGAAPGTIVPSITLSFDSLTKQWGFWETTVNSHTNFPLVAWTKRTGGQNATVAARTGEGLFSNGDIISINDNLIPVDTLLGSAGVYAIDVYEVDTYTASGVDTGSNIETIIRTGLISNGSAYNFQSKELIEMENTPSSQTLTIKHSDESSNDFNTGRTIDTSVNRKELYQGGRFVRRNYQIEYSGDEQFFMKYLEVDVGAGL